MWLRPAGRPKQGVKLPIEIHRTYCTGGVFMFLSQAVSRYNLMIFAGSVDLSKSDEKLIQ